MTFAVDTCFEHYCFFRGLHDLRRHVNNVWDRYLCQQISLTVAAFITNTAFDLARTAKGQFWKKASTTHGYMEVFVKQFLQEVGRRRDRPCLKKFDVSSLDEYFSNEDMLVVASFIFLPAWLTLGTEKYRLFPAEDEDKGTDDSSSCAGKRCGNGPFMSSVTEFVEDDGGHHGPHITSAKDPYTRTTASMKSSVMDQENSDFIQTKIWQNVSMSRPRIRACRILSAFFEAHADQMQQDGRSLVEDEFTKTLRIHVGPAPKNSSSRSDKLTNNFPLGWLLLHKYTQIYVCNRVKRSALVTGMKNMLILLREVSSVLSHSLHDQRSSG